MPKVYPRVTLASASTLSGSVVRALRGGEGLPNMFCPGEELLLLVLLLFRLTAMCLNAQEERRAPSIHLPHAIVVRLHVR